MQRVSFLLSARSPSRKGGVEVTKYHITIEDRKQDAKNGRKAKGSTWGKGSKKGHKKRRVTARDRRVDRRNGRKAKGW